MGGTGAAGPIGPGREDGLVELTLLFTDIEGSTRLWEADPGEMPQALQRHFELLDASIEAHGGRVIDRAGDGVFAAFASAAQAAASAVDAQRALTGEAWPTSTPLRVRMGLHTGSVIAQGPALTGTQVHRAARLADLAHGGQVVISAVTNGLLAGVLPDGAATRSLGEHRLRDLEHAEHVHQLVVPGLPDEFPALRSGGSRGHNLPAALSGFVGRERERASVSAALEEHRLVTLTGAGGVGKTRLAVRVARDRVEADRGDTWLVELGSVTTETDVVNELLDRLGISQRANEDPVTALVTGLGDATAMLVVDNCEHVIDTTALLLDQLLQGCPRLSILATSREPLGITGEAVVRVPSLPVGGAEGHGDAEQLFIERAHAADPGWEPTDDELEDVAAICRRLDGLPLAIELAAARVRTLSVPEVRERLDSSFGLLTSGSRSALPRQRTLEATVSWSHDLLDEDERLALAVLSVFVSPFDLDAAEAVLAPLLDTPTLDLITALADKSLLQRVRQGRKTRYRMLETVRFYARERLVATSRAEDVYAAHLRWAVGVASKADGLVMSGTVLDQDAQEVLDVLSVPDLRAAVHHAEQLRDVDAALSIVVDLYNFVSLGSHGEAYESLTRFLAMAEADGADPLLRSRGHGCISEILAFSHDAEGALREATVAMELLEGTDDVETLGWAHHNLAMALWANGDLEAAREADEAALEAFEAVGTPVGLGRCSYELAVWEIAHGSDARAREHQERMVRIRTPVGPSPIGHLHVLEIEALLALRAAEPESARTNLLAAIEMHREMAFGQCLAHLLDHAALWAARTGDERGAARLLGAGATVRGDLIGTDVQPFERAFHDEARATAHAALGAAGFQEEHQLGAARTMMSSLDLAVEVLGASPDRA